MCREVLNLPKQAGFRYMRSALAEAYRVTLIMRSPFIKCWLKTEVLHHEHSRVIFLYHKPCILESNI